MENLIEYLLQYRQLNSQQIALIKNAVKVIDLEVNAYFLEAGRIANQIAFVEKGILRVCYYNKKGTEKVVNYVR